MDFSVANLAGGLLFSGAGFVAFSYGRREGDARTMALGGALMAYSYFMPGAAWTWGVGAVLTAALFLPRD